MKHLFLLIAACIATVAQAQDVIVKRDGSTILTKVLEVNQADIKYKKFSNQQGPTYTINKSEVMAINYESGDKDTFEDEAQAVVSMQVPANTSTPFGVNPNLAEDNLKLVKQFNSHNPIYLGNDTKKKYINIAQVLGIKEGSIIETPELKASFSMKIWHGKVTTFGHNVVEERLINLGEEKPFKYSNFQYKIVIILKNKTDKTIYIDLANSYFLRNNNAFPYYVPTATSTTHGGTSGGSVNLGAALGAFGVGGNIGTLANGVNIGGSNTTVNTRTTYSQRIVSIPPNSSLEMNPMEIGQGMTWVTARRFEYKADIEKAYIPYYKQQNKFKETEYWGGVKAYLPTKDFKRGETINIPPLDDINPLSAFVTYSFDELMSTTQSMRIDFYLRQLLGVGTDGLKNVDFSQCPLIFF